MRSHRLREWANRDKHLHSCSQALHAFTRAHVHKRARTHAHKLQGFKQSPEWSCVSVCARAHTWSCMISWLVFSNVRFRNTHTHSDYVTAAGVKLGRKGVGCWGSVNSCMSIQTSPLTEGQGETGEISLPAQKPPLAIRNVRDDATIYVAFVSIFSGYRLNYIGEACWCCSKERRRGLRRFALFFPKGRNKSNGKNFIATRHDLFTLWCLPLCARPHCASQACESTVHIYSGVSSVLVLALTCVKREVASAPSVVCVRAIRNVNEWPNELSGASVGEHIRNSFLRSSCLPYCVPALPPQRGGWNSLTWRLKWNDFNSSRLFSFLVPQGAKG